MIAKGEQDALLVPTTKPPTRRNSAPSISASQIQEALKKERSERRRRRAEQRSYSITRRTVRRFRSKLILFDPEEMCLCGLLSITHSVHLVVCIEIFFALVLLIQAPDLLTMDGTYFYFLGLFDGGGFFFFTLHVSVCVTCLISSAILYLGSRKQIASLILPHLFWQFSFIIISIVSIIALMTLGIQGRMLLPASIVLSSMMGVAGGCEVWWCILSLTYYRYVRDGKSWIGSSSSHNLLNEYRDTLYIIFGIVCLVSWLCFNLWALREFFCPAIFGRKPKPREERLEFIKLKYVSSGQFLINLTDENRNENENMGTNKLEIFVV